MQEKGKDFKDIVLPPKGSDSEHSLICNENLFYAELRAAAEDAEKDVND
ncbi:hypothetical protein M3182_20650 [Mesobacillus maritimus]|nr:hypothetical protein [Mesobacillus maritimus]MCM3588117.1 hypothetical protein [Mesobacillus maritimus]MCM3668447.1 hypothetical protein [Mesobacillus maritimus]